MLPASQRRRWTSMRRRQRPVCGPRCCRVTVALQRHPAAPAPVGGCVVSQMPSCAVAAHSGAPSGTTARTPCQCTCLRVPYRRETRPAVRGAAVQSPRGRDRAFGGHTASAWPGCPATRTRCRYARSRQPRCPSITTGARARVAVNRHSARAEVTDGSRTVPSACPGRNTRPSRCLRGSLPVFGADEART